MKRSEAKGKVIAQLYSTRCYKYNGF